VKSYRRGITSKCIPETLYARNERNDAVGHGPEGFYEENVMRAFACPSGSGPNVGGGYASSKNPSLPEIYSANALKQDVNGKSKRTQVRCTFRMTYASWVASVVSWVQGEELVVSGDDIAAK
jgi:hypothetical protein